jgi:hypothetical protein
MTLKKVDLIVFQGYTEILNFERLSVVILNVAILNVIGKTLPFVFALLQDIDK